MQFGQRYCFCSGRGAVSPSPEEALLSIIFCQRSTPCCSVRSMYHLCPHLGQSVVPSGTTEPHWRQNLGPDCVSPSGIVAQKLSLSCGLIIHIVKLNLKAMSRGGSFDGDVERETFRQSGGFTLWFPRSYSASGHQAQVCCRQLAGSSPARR